MGFNEANAVPSTFPIAPNPVNGPLAIIKPGFTNFSAVVGTSEIAKNRLEPIERNALSNPALVPAVLQNALNAAEEAEKQRIEAEFKQAIEEAKARARVDEGNPDLIIGTISGKPSELNPWILIGIAVAALLFVANFAKG